MATHDPTSRRVDQTTIILEIERILETGWLNVGALRSFVRMLDAAEISDKEDAQVWWRGGPDGEPARIEVIKAVPIDPRRES